MSYFKTTNHLERRDNLIAFRASTKDRFKAEELKSLMNCNSTAEVFRKLLDESVFEVGVPDHVKDDVTLASLVVEGHVILNSHLVEQIQHGHRTGEGTRTVDLAIAAVAEVAVFTVATLVLQLQLVRHLLEREAAGAVGILPVLFSEP